MYENLKLVVQNAGYDWDDFVFQYRNELVDAMFAGDMASLNASISQTHPGVNVVDFQSTFTTDVATGGTTPGGLDRQVQFNNATVMGGASNVRIGSSGSLELSADSSVVAPSSSRVALFGRSLGGRMIPAFMGQADWIVRCSHTLDAIRLPTFSLTETQEQLHFLGYRQRFLGRRLRQTSQQRTSILTCGELSLTLLLLLMLSLGLGTHFLSLELAELLPVWEGFILFVVGVRLSE